MRYYWYCIHLCICPDNLRPYGDKSAKQSALSSKVNNLGCNLRCHSIPVYAYINHSVARNAPKTMVYKTYCSYTYDSIHFFALTYCSIKNHQIREYGIRRSGKRTETTQEERRTITDTKGGRGRVGSQDPYMYINTHVSDRTDASVTGV